MMTDPLLRESGLLRVAFPSTRNTQQIERAAEVDATKRATATQQIGLKALALRALSRNNPATADATGLSKGSSPAQRAEPENDAFVAQIRNRLRHIAEAEVVDTSLIDTLPDADVLDCESLSEPARRAFVLMLRDTHLRAQGKCPAGETAPALCRKCGPVWLASEVAAHAPNVSGWPVVLGCPWCTYQRQGRGFPRPPVGCVACTSFVPDPINPAGGIGPCSKGMAGGSQRYPHVKHQCAGLLPKGSP